MLKYSSLDSPIYSFMYCRLVSRSSIHRFICSCIFLSFYLYIHLGLCCNSKMDYSDAVHENVSNGENVVQKTYQGINQNKNHRNIHSSFRDIEFLLEKSKPRNLLESWRKSKLNILSKTIIQ